MKASLSERLEKQVANEAALRKARRFETESIVKLGAMLYVVDGKEVDTNRLKECKRILKDKAGIFSNLRGIMQFIVCIKMALSDDPEGYVDGVLGVYKRLKEGFILPGEQVAMAATTIFDHCPPERLDEVTDKTLTAYKAIKSRHRFLTGEEDLALVALMILAGVDVTQAADRAEELFQILKGSFLPGSETPQSAAMVLALSDEPAEKKVQDFLALREACKEAGCATPRDLTMVIYAAFADLDVDRVEVVRAIAETEEWLRGKKGYGPLGVGKKLRCLFAAAFVLEDYQQAESSIAVNVTSAVTQAIVEELIIILVTIIITSTIISVSNSQSSGN